MAKVKRMVMKEDDLSDDELIEEMRRFAEAGAQRKSVNLIDPTNGSEGPALQPGDIVKVREGVASVAPGTPVLVAGIVPQAGLAYCIACTPEGQIAPQFLGGHMIAEVVTSGGNNAPRRQTAVRTKGPRGRRR